MDKFLEKLYDRAAKANRKIALAEGTDHRVVKAAEILTKKRIARVVLIGDGEVIKSKFPDIDFSGIEIVNPATSEKADEYAVLLYELRKSKGMTLEQAQSLVKSHPLYFGTTALKAGDIDGLVGGAVYSSADVLRSALQVIKAAPGIKSVSSCFVLVPPDGFKYCSAPAMIFSDCAVIPEPDSAQLADITVAAAESARSIVQVEPKIAMLSFSTKGSAKHDSVCTVQRALHLVKENYPDLAVDGELQLDAAIVPVVAKQKAPDSKVAGDVNVLIFPNLSAGNIGYKIAQRFGNCMAIGPIMQGLDKPVNDLSRGCVAEDIVAAAAITALQSVK